MYCSYGISGKALSVAEKELSENEKNESRKSRTYNRWPTVQKR